LSAGSRGWNNRRRQIVRDEENARDVDTLPRKQVRDATRVDHLGADVCVLRCNPAEVVVETFVKQRFVGEPVTT
jgi:hypothetical protein